MTDVSVYVHVYGMHTCVRACSRPACSSLVVVGRVVQRTAALCHPGAGPGGGGVCQSVSV